MTVIHKAAEGLATPARTGPQDSGQAAPLGVDALLWQLSSPQERQALLQALSLVQAQAKAAHPSVQPNETATARTRDGQGLAAVRALPSWLDAPARAAAAGHDGVGDRAQSEQAGLDAAVQGFQGRFAAAASDPARFNAMARAAFGEHHDASKLEAIRQQSLAGDFSWMPEIKLADAASLRDLTGAHVHIRGAYAQAKDTVYLNRDLLKDPVIAEQVLGEEIGHAIDARINTNDAAGDEGHLFTELLHGQSVDAKELVALRAENDHGAIQIGGLREDVEFDDGGGDSGSSASESSSSSSSSESSSSASDSSASSSEGSSESSESGENSVSAGSEGACSEGADGGSEAEATPGCGSASSEAYDSADTGADDSASSDSFTDVAAPALAAPEGPDARDFAPKDADAGDDEDDADPAKIRDAKPKEPVREAAREAAEATEEAIEAGPDRDTLQARFRQMERQYRRENDSSTLDGTMLAAGMPMNGPPNTWRPNPSGSGQWRFYGSDGRPSVDLDSDHSHNGMRPHAHNWNGDNRNGAVAPFSPYPAR